MAFLSKIDNISDMFCKSEALEALYEYLKNACGKDKERILSLKSGGDYSKDRIEVKHDLGFGMTAIEQSYFASESVLFESHKKFVDFQLLVGGVECMSVGSAEHFSIKCEYDESKDAAFYTQNDATSEILLYPNDLLVLFPHDIHAGGILSPKIENGAIFKSVVKVPLSLLKFRF